MDTFNQPAHPYIRLRNDVKIPILGLGTSHSGGYSHKAVVTALRDCGYRLIDTAKRYGCEELLARAIKDSGVPREQLFIITKPWLSDYGSGPVLDAFYGSLHRLDTHYLDLYMLHYPECLPPPGQTKKQVLEETWRRLELLYDEGLCRAIGVSNYQVEDLEALMDHCGVVPHINQVEFHPFNNPLKLRSFCHHHHIQFQGYCPLGKGHLLREPEVLEVADHCCRTPAQVLIRWSIQNGAVTIPKSTNPDRVRENAQVFDFELSQKDMKQLNSVHDGRKYVDTSTILHKLSQNLPDGYKLHILDLPDSL